MSDKPVWKKGDRVCFAHSDQVFVVECFHPDPDNPMVELEGMCGQFGSLIFVAAPISLPPIVLEPRNPSGKDLDAVAEEEEIARRTDGRLNVQYDAGYDVLTVDGKKFSGDFFRFFDQKFAGRLFQLVSVSDAITVKEIRPGAEGRAYYDDLVRQRGAAVAFAIAVDDLLKARALIESLQAALR